MLLAAHRARAISNGSPITVERENDKNPVIALREIADETVPADDMREGLIHSSPVSLKYCALFQPCMGMTRTFGF